MKESALQWYVLVKNGKLVDAVKAVSAADAGRILHPSWLRTQKTTGASFVVKPLSEQCPVRKVQRATYAETVRYGNLGEAKE